MEVATWWDFGIKIKGKWCYCYTTRCSSLVDAQQIIEKDCRINKTKPGRWSARPTGGNYEG